MIHHCQWTCFFCAVVHLSLSLSSTECWLSVSTLSPPSFLHAYADHLLDLIGYVASQSSDDQFLIQSVKIMCARELLFVNVKFNALLKFCLFIVSFYIIFPA